MDVQEVERLLRERRLFLTPQRRAILEYLSDNPEHPTAARVFEAVTRGQPVTSRATVYNTLALFQELGVLQEVNLPGKEARFDPNDEPHHHFHCGQCDTLFDIPAAQVQVAATNLGPMQVERSSVLFEGVCASCAG
ncbi:MAG: transcriptional repressor [Alphaproteobacteria bacterium]|nr:transcriptional repressor [Alphaproteobacteria bacterium]MCB9793853.1 transcriptional repressor [Alphaproteobacteria bacterium]